MKTQMLVLSQKILLNIIGKNSSFGSIDMKLPLSVLLIVMILQVQAEPQYGTVTVSKVISVYDGDVIFSG
jgi:hypothetical protein